MRADAAPLRSFARAADATLPFPVTVPSAVAGSGSIG